MIKKINYKSAMASRSKIKEKAAATGATNAATAAVRSPPNIEIDACQQGDLLPTKISEDEWSVFMYSTW